MMSGQVGPTTGPRRNSVTQKQRGPSTVRRSSSSDNNGNGIAPKPSSPPLPQSSSAGVERTVKKLRLSKALTIPEGTTVSDARRRMAARRVDAVLLTYINLTKEPLHSK